MLGMETLLANMLGVTPEQMRDTIGSAVNLLSSLDARLNNIERMVTEIHALDFPKSDVVLTIEEHKSEAVQ